MATAESIAIRRSEALGRAEAAAEAIASATGAAFAPFPAPARDHELRPALEAEWLAGTLEAIAATFGPRDTPADAPGSPERDESADDDPVDLEALTRAELDAHAAGLGIDGADKLPNKGAVVEAIRAAQAEAEKADADTDTDTDAGSAP